MDNPKLYKLNYLFLLLASINGAILFILQAIKPVKLWREVFLIGFAIFLIFSLKRMKLLSIFLLHISLGFSFFQIFSSSNPIVEVYQMRLDLFLPIYLIIIYELYKSPPDQTIIKKLLKTLLILGILNAIFAAIEFFVAGVFLDLLKIETGNWGVHGGIRLITTNGNLRAPGLLTGFVQSGDFILLSIFLLWSDFVKKFIYTSTKQRIIFSIILMTGLYCTTYKTGLLGLFFFLVFMTIRQLSKKKNNLLILFSGLLLFTLHFVSYNTLIVYNFFKDIFPIAAERSIKPRIEQNTAIYENMGSIYNFLFGNGYGKNGTFGLDKTKYFADVLPLDSSYIYLLSNYGILFVIAFVLFLVYFSVKYIRFDHFNMIFFLLYFLSIEFFVNNIFLNTPTIYILINLLILTFSLHRKYEN